MKENLAFEVFYPHPPEQVWRALTDPAALAKWLMPNDFRPEIGLRFRFHGLDRCKTGAVKGTVLSVEPGVSLTYSWDDGEDDAPGIVCWTLSPVDGGTRVRLEHRIDTDAKSTVSIEAAMNWPVAIHLQLPALLREMAWSTRPPVPIVYVLEEEPVADRPMRRAGFRQEEATCR
ncbi:MAG: SRPBCC domain-containing protein [Fimbriimonas sp.]|nr:SRPBCC domain-containing protein [Fimbriimonas sp.]